MTVAAVDLGHVSQVHWMLEAELLCRCGRYSAFFLPKNRVASVTFFRHYFALRAYVLTIVAAETPVEVEVPNVIRMSLPIQLHLRERGPAKDVLQLIDRVTYLKRLRRRELGILVRIEIVNVLGDTFHGSLGARVVCGQCTHRLLLEVWQRCIQSPGDK